MAALIRMGQIPGSMLLFGGYGYGNDLHRHLTQGGLRAMMSDHFERPVVILVGLGHPAAISSVMEAYMFLVDWPPSKRDPAHGFAIKSCLAALRGEVEAETVRALFATLAEKYGIVAPDDAAFTASYREGPQGRA
ncbi:DUF982 domain-containing protein [Bosea sp. Root483D1]|uniref:DUF982 domain-containing protein n=1 Tax=Bosea sp. Root483D1 TaxID=1736544 RepID=UPI002A4E183C|nr:DUF982 domain-containing protein [Bosea sp. Root483D1]